MVYSDYSPPSQGGAGGRVCLETCINKGIVGGTYQQSCAQHEDDNTDKCFGGHGDEGLEG